MTLATDFRSAFRNVRRGGWLSATVVLILAVAIGAVTAIFSIAHAVLIRPLPVAEPDRVMLLWGRDDARSQQVVEVSLLDQRAWLAGQKSFTAIELFGSVNWGELHVTGPGQPFRAVQNAVSSGFFDVLGARPMIGRTFRPADDLGGARPTVVLSADVWRQQFSSDPAVVGRLLTVGTGRKAVAFEVIGVMPPDFRIPAGAQVWTALGPALAAGAADRDGRLTVSARCTRIGRLAPGATVENAVAELSTIARNEELKNGMANTSMAVVATPLMTHLLGPARPALLAIAGASGALLLIACANAAALLLVHGAARRREVAVRFALGARRLQIVRQLFCESIVLSLIAGVAGCRSRVRELRCHRVARSDRSASPRRGRDRRPRFAVCAGPVPGDRGHGRALSCVAPQRRARRSPDFTSVRDRRPRRPLPRARANCSWRRSSRRWWCS